jgi:hypothetical protein
MLSRGHGWLILASMLLGCSSTPRVTDGGVASDGGIRPGDACNNDSGSVLAPDGCNTCSCNGGVWVCTDIACPTTCTPGETKPAGDGCNTCRCSDDRKWGCTLVACPVCTPGETTPVGTCPACTCTGVGQWSCEATNCPIDSGIEGGGRLDAFEAGSDVSDAPGRIDSGIEDGGPPDISDSGAGGGWCGNFGSPFEGGVPPHVYEGGIRCGTKACGARAGNTCTANEYCAYRIGEHCGAADAQSTCQLRPPGCNADHHPVCGCDQKTYGNACVAAQAGTGVLKLGPCDTDSGADDADPDAACGSIGSACTPAEEGRYCNNCGSPCQWCWTVRCSAGTWIGMEVPPYPPSHCQDGGDAG